MHEHGSPLAEAGEAAAAAPADGTNGAKGTQLRRDSLFLQIYEQLCTGLSGGRFRPGESVTLRQLADDFGTSIMPVREAVSRLISEGALCMLPNRKVIVPEMTRDRFQDLTELRRLIEPVAAARATQRLPEPQIAQLAQINDEVLAGIAAGDVARALGANRDFHMKIYQAAGSEPLMQAISNTWLQVGPFLYHSMTSKQVPWTTAHHVLVITALRNHDAKAAAQSILDDIDESASHLLETRFRG